MLPPDQKRLAPQKPDATPNQTPFAPSAALESGGMSAGAAQSAPSMSTLINAFRRCWLLALLLAIPAGAITAGIIWYVMPPEYVSEIQFTLESKAPIGSLEDENNFASVQKAQVTTVRSLEILDEVIQKSHVAELYSVYYTPRQLQKKVKASFPEGPNVMVVSLAGENPEAVAAMLNALGEVYPKKVNGAYQARLKKWEQELEDRLRINPRREFGQKGTLAEQLRDKRIELTKAEKDAGVDDKTILAKAKRAEKQLELSETAHNKTKRDLNGLEAKLRTREARLDSQPEIKVPRLEAVKELRGSSGFQKVEEDLNRLQEKMEYIRKTNNEPFLSRELAGPRSQMKKLLDIRKTMIDDEHTRLMETRRTKLLNDRQQEIEDLKDEIEKLRAEEPNLAKEVRQWRIQAELYQAGGPKPPPEVERLRDEVRQLTREYDSVGQKLAEYKGQAQPDRVRRLFPAGAEDEVKAPTEPEMAKPIKYASVGGVLMIGFVVGGLCLLEARRRRVSNSDDIMTGLGMPILGTLPLLPTAARNKTTQAQSLGGLDGRYGMTESVDAIRTMLMHAPHVDGARVVMISSAVGGEGKTTLASHLAASLARAWRKTLLIDGDLRNPAQHIQFDQPNEPGLCEALRSEVEFEDVIKPTLISRLWMVPAGKVDPHALQALTQEGLSEVFEALKEQYDFIVIDTSPVLPVTDALLFGKQADAVLLSVMRDVSRLPAVAQAHHRLDSLGIRVLGAVVIGEKMETYGHAIPYPPQGT